MASLAFHVTHTTEPAHWLARCLTSLRGQSVRIINGAGLSTAANRAQAIGESRAEFIAWCDPDDWIAASHLPAILDALNDRPGAVGAFSSEATVDEHGEVITPADCTPGAWRPLSQLTSPKYAHNLTVLRRVHALPYLEAMQPFRTLSEYALKGLITERGHLLRIPVPAYFWRQHPAQLHRQTTREEHAAAIRLVSPALRAHMGIVDRVRAPIAAALAVRPTDCPKCKRARSMVLGR